MTKKTYQFQDITSELLKSLTFKRKHYVLYKDGTTDFLWRNEIADSFEYIVGILLPVEEKQVSDDEIEKYFNKDYPPDTKDYEPYIGSLWDIYKKAFESGVKYSQLIGGGREEKYRDLWLLMEEINTIMWESYMIEDREFGRTEGYKIMGRIEQWAERH